MPELPLPPDCLSITKAEVDQRLVDIKTNSLRTLASLHLRSLTPLAAACVGTFGVMCVMEGALLADRRLAFLSRFYTLNAVTLVAAFKLVEHLGGGLHAAWSCMLAFMLVRVCTFGLALRERRGV